MVLLERGQLATNSRHQFVRGRLLVVAWTGPVPGKSHDAHMPTILGQPVRQVAEVVPGTDEAVDQQRGLSGSRRTEIPRFGTEKDTGTWISWCPAVGTSNQVLAKTSIADVDQQQRYQDVDEDQPNGSAHPGTTGRCFVILCSLAPGRTLTVVRRRFHCPSTSDTRS